MNDHYLHYSTLAYNDNKRAERERQRKSETIVTKSDQNTQTFAENSAITWRTQRTESQFTPYLLVIKNRGTQMIQNAQEIWLGSKI